MISFFSRAVLLGGHNSAWLLHKKYTSYGRRQEAYTLLSLCLNAALKYRGGPRSETGAAAGRRARTQERGREQRRARASVINGTGQAQ